MHYSTQTSLFLRSAIIVLSFALLFGVSTFVYAEGEEVPAPPPEVVTEPQPEPQPEPVPEPLPEPLPEADGTVGADGTDGTDVPSGEPIPEDPAIIETGDAVAGVNADNTPNITDLESLSGDLTASTTNEAIVDNDAEAAAETGGNTASGGGGAYVGTGDAVAFANVINVVNTNIINSTGLIAFFNYIFGAGFDLRALGLDYFLNPTDTGCSLGACSDSDVTLNVDNTATLTNDVVVRADTGTNTAEGGDGAAIIETGNAYAAANLINVINTSLVGSRYLLITGNNFGSLQGDITLPGVEFFNSLFAQGGGSLGSLNANVVNGATVNDSTSAVAATGSNSASGDGSLVLTGDAVAGGTSYNQVNTTEVGGTSFFILVNVIGDWTGSVHGLPDGISWTRTPTGVSLMSDTGLGALGGGCCGDSTTFNATNTASLANNVNVYALTGENYATSDGGEAAIATGDAYAAANSVNIVNTNILGRNWFFAIFNIFGDWSGNVAFGHPDLWIGAVAEAPNPARPNHGVKYHFTVSNRGDADAHDVIITPEYADIMLDFGVGEEQVGSRRGWRLGDLKKGETKEFVFDATTGAVDAGRSVAVPLEITVTSNETDEDTEDNSDLVTIVVENFLSEVFSGAGRASPTGEPGIVLTKSASVATTTLPASVDYTVIVRNDGAEAYRTVLSDTLRDPEGGKVYSRTWDLKTILPGE